MKWSRDYYDVTIHDIHDNLLYEEWIALHDSKCNNSNIVFALNMSSGIGTNVYVKCRNCRRRKDITDYFSW